MAMTEKNYKLISYATILIILSTLVCVPKITVVASD